MKAPQISVVGLDYPMTDFKRQVASIIQLVAFMLIALVISGKVSFGGPENKWTSIIVIYFFGTTIASLFTRSGALEVYLGHSLVWSTLANGRMPSYQDLIAGFAQQGLDLK